MDKYRIIKDANGNVIIACVDPCMNVAFKYYENNSLMLTSVFLPDIYFFIEYNENGYIEHFKCDFVEVWREYDGCRLVLERTICNGKETVCRY